MSDRARRLERLFDAGIFADGAMVRKFWCNGCGRWTPPEAYSEYELELILGGDTVSPTCRACGDGFQCQECGHEIDQKGNCLREGGHGA